MNRHLCQSDYVPLLISENPLVCTCHEVRLQTIVAHLSPQIDTQTLNQIQQQTGMATGCGGCLSKLEGIIECFQLKPAAFATTEDAQ